MKHADPRIAKYLATTDKIEAVSWLGDSNDASYRFLAEWSNEESLDLIRDLYSRGAEKVWAMEFDVNPPYESINTLLVALPVAASPAAFEKRAAVFNWASERMVAQGFDPIEDAGQQYLCLWFD
jgi:hypothetical protein